MIVLDTNQAELLDVSPNPLFVMVRHVAEAREHQLAIPEMVLTEMLAHWRNKIETQLRAVRKAAAALENLRAPLPALSLPDVDDLVKRREDVLREQYSILPTPRDAAQEAMRREAHRLRPADVDWDKKGAGARDVVVWLTLLSASESCSGDLVFVSDDGDFFDKAGELHPDLKIEASEHAAHACLLRCARKTDDLLALLADKVDVPSDFDLLASSRMVIEGTVGSWAGDRGLGLVRLLKAAYGDRVRTSFQIRDLVADQRSKAYAYQVDESTWICARARWTGRLDVETSLDGADVSIPDASVPFTMDGSVLADGTFVPASAVMLLSSSVVFDESALDARTLAAALFPAAAAYTMQPPPPLPSLDFEDPLV